VILGATIRWLTDASAHANHEFPRDAKDRLAALAPGLEAQTGAVASPLLESLASVCRCRESARRLLHVAAEVTGDITPAAASALARHAVPFADGTFAADAAPLVNSDAPCKRILGLRLLGRSRGDGAAEMIRRELDAPDAGATRRPATGRTAGDPTARMGIDVLTDPSRAAPQASHDLRLAALAALGDLGDRQALPILKKITSSSAAAGLPSLKSSSMLSDENRVYEEATLSRIRCGDTEAAGDVVDLLLENLYLMSRARLYWDIVNQRPTRAQEALPQARAWQQELYERLQTVPDSVLPALATRLASEQDWRVVPIAFAALAGRDLPPEAKAILGRAKLPAVAALASPAAKPTD
jgi:hypothetical protein